MSDITLRFNAEASAEVTKAQLETENTTEGEAR